MLIKTTNNSHFENFPNELFYEIFDYLDTHDIYQSFFNLNHRFQNLFCSLNLQLKLRLDNQHENDYYNILNQQKHQIISLHFTYPNQIEQFQINSSFIRLQSLILTDHLTENFIEHLTNLTFLPCLSSLKILLHHNQVSLHEIYQHVFQISTLNYFKISSNIYQPRIFFITNIQWNSIQYLTMNHSCYLNDLYVILSYTSRLIRLTCQELLESTNIISNKYQTINFNCLNMISISECYVCFDKFEEFLKQISTYLQTIRIHTYWDANYLDVCRWENLIQKYMFKLKEFSFQHHDFLDDDFQLTEYHFLINRFQSSFWINLKHSLQLSIDVNDQLWTEIIYSLYPSKRISKDLKLTIINSFNKDFFSENIFMILNHLSITRLDILHDDISMEMFIDLIDYLPNLEAIKIHSFKFMKTNYCLFWKENRIKEISIWNLNQLYQIEFLIKFCSNLEYLEIYFLNEQIVVEELDHLFHFTNSFM